MASPLHWRHSFCSVVAPGTQLAEKKLATATDEREAMVSLKFTFAGTWKGGNAQGLSVSHPWASRGDQATPFLLQHHSQLSVCSFPTSPCSREPESLPSHLMSPRCRSVPIGICQPADLPRPVWQEVLPCKLLMVMSVPFFTTATA